MYHSCTRSECSSAACSSGITITPCSATAGSIEVWMVLAPRCTMRPASGASPMSSRTSSGSPSTAS